MELGRDYAEGNLLQYATGSRSGKRVRRASERLGLCSICEGIVEAKIETKDYFGHAVKGWVTP